MRRAAFLSVALAARPDWPGLPRAWLPGPAGAAPAGDDGDGGAEDGGAPAEPAALPRVSLPGQVWAALTGGEGAEDATIATAEPVELPRVSLPGQVWAVLAGDGGAAEPPEDGGGASSTTTTAEPTDYYLEAFRLLNANGTNATAPTPAPTPAPTGSPTASPTATPTGFPTSVPTPAPSAVPTAEPTPAPSATPTPAPTPTPTAPTPAPTPRPTDPAPADTALTVGIALTVSSAQFETMRNNVEEAERGLAAGMATFIGVPNEDVTVTGSNLRSRALLAGGRRLNDATLKVDYAVASDASVASITAKLDDLSSSGTAKSQLATSLKEGVEEATGTTVDFTVDEVSVEVVEVVPTPAPTPAPRATWSPTPSPGVSCLPNDTRDACRNDTGPGWGWWLVAILLVMLGIVGFVKKDKILELVGMGGSPDQEDVHAKSPPGTGFAPQPLKSEQRQLTALSDSDDASPRKQADVPQEIQDELAGIVVQFPSPARYLQ